MEKKRVWLKGRRWLRLLMFYMKHCWRVWTRKIKVFSERFRTNTKPLLQDMRVYVDKPTQTPRLPIHAAIFSQINTFSTVFLPPTIFAYVLQLDWIFEYLFTNSMGLTFHLNASKWHTWILAFPVFIFPVLLAACVFDFRQLHTAEKMNKLVLHMDSSMSNK